MTNTDREARRRTFQKVSAMRKAIVEGELQADYLSNIEKDSFRKIVNHLEELEQGKEVKDD